MFCPFCENEIPDGTQTCPHCMATFGGSTDKMPAQEAPAQQAQQVFEQAQAPVNAPAPSSGGGGPKIAVIAIVAAVVVAICVFAGLAFAGVISLPGGSQSAAKKLTPDEFIKQAADKVAQASDLDMSVEFDFGITSGYSRQATAMDVDGSLSLSVTGFDKEDFSKFAASGEMSGNLTQTVGSGQPQSISIEGTAEYKNGMFTYKLTQPSKSSSSVPMKPDELKELYDQYMEQAGTSKSDAKLEDSEYIKDLKLEGNTVSFSIDFDKVMSSEDLQKLLNQSLRQYGVSMGDVQITADTCDVVIEVTNPDTGAMTMTFTCEGSIQNNRTTAATKSDFNINLKYEITPK